jgi:hypothetical protein
VTKLKDKPFARIGIHIGGSNAKQLKEVMEKEKITWRSFVDAGNAGAGPIARRWNLSATPTFYVIDHKGVIRYKWGGRTGREGDGRSAGQTDHSGGSEREEYAEVTLPRSTGSIAVAPDHQRKQNLGKPRWTSASDVQYTDGVGAPSIRNPEGGSTSSTAAASRSSAPRRAC